MIKKGSTVFYLPYGVYGEMIIEQGKVIGTGKGKTLTIETPSGIRVAVRLEHVAETHFELSSFWTTISRAEKSRYDVGVALEGVHKQAEDLEAEESRLVTEIDDLYRKRKTMVCSRLR